MLPPMGDLAQLRRESERRLGVDVEASRYTHEQERSKFQDAIGLVAPFFMGVFTYLVSYGLLLTFGLLAMLGLTLGFATLPSPSDMLSSSTTFSTPTPTSRAASSTASTVKDAPKTSTADRLRGFVRIIAFGTAFLAIWPAFLAGSLTNRYLNY